MYDLEITIFHYINQKSKIVAAISNFKKVKTAYKLNKKY